MACRDSEMAMHDDGDVGFDFRGDSVNGSRLQYVVSWELWKEWVRGCVACLPHHFSPSQYMMCMAVVLVGRCVVSGSP